MLFTYNEQDDIALHYLSKFDGKTIMAAENYFSVDREATLAESEETTVGDQSPGLYPYLMKYHDQSIGAMQL